MLVLNRISHKYDFAVRILQANTQFAPPPNPPIDTTQGWKETHLTIHYRRYPQSQLRSVFRSAHSALISYLCMSNNQSKSLHITSPTRYSRTWKISAQWNVSCRNISA